MGWLVSSDTERKVPSVLFISSGKKLTWIRDSGRLVQAASCSRSIKSGQWVLAKVLSRVSSWNWLNVVLVRRIFLPSMQLTLSMISVMKVLFSLYFRSSKYNLSFLLFIRHTFLLKLTPRYSHILNAHDRYIMILSTRS